MHTTKLFAFIPTIETPVICVQIVNHEIFFIIELRQILSSQNVADSKGRCLSFPAAIELVEDPPVPKGFIGSTDYRKDIYNLFSE